MNPFAIQVLLRPTFEGIGQISCDFLFFENRDMNLELTVQVLTRLRQLKIWC